MNPGEDTKLRPKAAAERLGIHESMLAKLRMTGDGPPFFRIGGSIIYTQTELDEWFVSKRATGTLNDGRKGLGAETRERGRSTLGRWCLNGPVPGRPATA